MPDPKEIHSIDSATVIIGKDTGKSKAHAREIDTKLTEVDKAFIADCVEKGLTKDTTYSALTEHRLNTGKPRVMKIQVDKEFDSLSVLDKANIVCPISGLRADTVVRFRLLSKAKDGNVAVNLCLPIHSSVMKDNSSKVDQVAIDSANLSSFTLLKELPLLKETSFVGSEK